MAISDSLRKNDLRDAITGYGESRLLVWREELHDPQVLQSLIKLNLPA
jgi:hypothetical protein